MKNPPVCIPTKLNGKKLVLTDIILLQRERIYIFRVFARKLAWQFHLGSENCSIVFRKIILDFRVGGGGGKIL